jgi:hypothetical protein
MNRVKRRQGFFLARQIIPGLRHCNEGKSLKMVCSNKGHHKFINMANRQQGFAQLLSAVLWIRIRNNPNVLTGSESESAKKNLDTDSDSDTVVGWTFLWKIKNQTLEREKSYVFLFDIFFSDVQVSEHIWKQLEAPFRKIWGQNISLRIRIRIPFESESEQNNLWIRIRKKWVRIHNTACQPGLIEARRKFTNFIVGSDT